jgi:hypothetical protein
MIVEIFGPRDVVLLVVGFREFGVVFRTFLGGVGRRTDSGTWTCCTSDFYRGKFFVRENEKNC